MIPLDIPSEHRVSDSVCIHITSRQNIDPEWAARTLHPYVPKESFAKAVDLALVKAGLFGGVVRCSENPNYQLDLHLVHTGAELAVSRFGTTYAVLVANWKLIDLRNSQILIDEQITGSFGLRWGGTTRGLEAMEGAARDNIKQGLSQIAQSLE